MLIVAQDGRPGAFTSVQAAVDAVPPGRGPVTILIEPGTYWGQVTLAVPTISRFPVGSAVQVRQGAAGQEVLGVEAAS